MSVLVLQPESDSAGAVVEFEIEVYTLVPFCSL